MMQWVIAAIRPLVLTMGPLVLTIVFCGLGMFTSCSKDDNPESETEDPDVGATACLTHRRPRTGACSAGQVMGRKLNM